MLKRFFQLTSLGTWVPFVWGSQFYCRGTFKVPNTDTDTKFGLHDTQQNDTQHNGAQHNDTKHNDNQHHNKMRYLRNGTQHNDKNYSA
jgi:hypothetical protein